MNPITEQRTLMRQLQQASLRMMFASEVKSPTLKTLRSRSRAADRFAELAKRYAASVRRQIKARNGSRP